MSHDDIDLEDAYGLKSPEDSVRLYQEWARTYDDDFARSLGYVYPAKVAAAFSKVALAEDVPILDAGCGTGLVGEMLKDVTIGPVDGLDISPEMLEVASEKQAYRNLVVGNLLEIMNIPDNAYGAVVSAGTFTFGHVGPEGLNELVRVARPGGLFVIGVSAGHFAAADFEGYMDDLQGRGQISLYTIEAVQIYQGQDHEHAGDEARMLIFRKS